VLIEGLLRASKTWTGRDSFAQKKCKKRLTESWADTRRATLVQMVGRAGRPGYDQQGVAVIMTEAGHEANFYDLASGLVKVNLYFLRLQFFL